MLFCMLKFLASSSFYMFVVYDEFFFVKATFKEFLCFVCRLAPYIKMISFTFNDKKKNYKEEKKDFFSFKRTIMRFHLLQKMSTIFLYFVVASLLLYFAKKHLRINFFRFTECVYLYEKNGRRKWALVQNLNIQPG